MQTKVIKHDQHKVQSPDEFTVVDKTGEIDIDPGDTYRDTNGDYWLFVDDNCEGCFVCISNPSFTCTSVINSDDWISYPIVQVELRATLEEIS